ncbi:MAG: glycosyltransferase [Calditrichaeota bacterium]|nr:glycosyltransferase [Calditrichota bacterium]
MLSIIIPVLDEAGKIHRDIENILNFQKQTSCQLETIIVDDGSGDNLADVLGSYLNKSAINLKLVKLKTNVGKGHAVKIGVNQSKGQYICIMDSGNTVPLKYITKGIKIIENEKLDFAWGSRNLDESKILIDKVWYRRFTSFLFRNLVTHLFEFKNLTDTQCGFKVFKGSVAKEIWKECKIDGFLFDIEVLLLAKEKKFTSREFPIEWTCDRDSRLSLFRNFFGFLKQIQSLKKRFL